MPVSAASSRLPIRAMISISRFEHSRRWVQNWGSSDDTAPPPRVVTNRRTAHPPIGRSRFRAGHRLDARRLATSQRLHERSGATQPLRARGHAGTHDRRAAVPADDDHIAGQSGPFGGHQAGAGAARGSPAADRWRARGHSREAAGGDSDQQQHPLHRSRLEPDGDDARLSSGDRPRVAAALYDAGMTGVAHQQTYDLWWHGGFRSTPTRHNIVGILTEAASTRLGSPITLSSDSVRQPGRGVNYPAPWPGGTWHLGDIVRYELITSQALVRLAARDRVNVIDRFVGLGRREVEAGLAGNPFAYVLPPPPDQRDPEAWATLAT